MNLSEGRSLTVLQGLAETAGDALLDLHHDPYHHRSVLTLCCEDIVEVALAVASRALQLIDLRDHRGVHPRLGVVDVVPFVPLGREGLHLGGDLEEALSARDVFAELAAKHLSLPCFLYGPERSLPELRRRAFSPLVPDHGPPRADPRSGACCVGARSVLVAYNLVLESGDLELARRIAREIRQDGLRTLGLRTGEETQVSCNLLDPMRLGPQEVFDLVEQRAPIRRAELVGLIPRAVFDLQEPSRRKRLGLVPSATIEARRNEGYRFVA